MAIIVEDGSIVPTANSYVTVAELTAYASARGLTISADEEQLLIKSMDYVENLEFQGIKLSRDQPLQWPRSDVMVDSYSIDPNTIPQLLKDGQCEVALAIDDGEDPLATIPRTKIRASVGAVSVEYANGQSTSIVRTISAKLRKLLSGSGDGGTSFIVSRG